MDERTPPTTLTVTASFDSYLHNSGVNNRYVGAVVSNKHTNITVSIEASVNFDNNDGIEAISMAVEVYDINVGGENDRLLHDYERVLEYLEENKYVFTPREVFTRFTPYADHGVVRGLVQTDTRIQAFCNPQPKISLQALLRWLKSVGVQTEGEHKEHCDKFFHALTGIASFANDEPQKEQQPQPQYDTWATW